MSKGFRNVNVLVSTCFNSNENQNLSSDGGGPACKDFVYRNAKNSRGF